LPEPLAKHLSSFILLPGLFPVRSGGLQEYRIKGMKLEKIPGNFSDQVSIYQI
jgi:hypothetical protein